MAEKLPPNHYLRTQQKVVPPPGPAPRPDQWAGWRRGQGPHTADVGSSDTVPTDLVRLSEYGHFPDTDPLSDCEVDCGAVERVMVPEAGARTTQVSAGQE
ncbi:hypothetical protein J6590_047112 [Homalodisca vitripennis]|nr:hypothetical protein J6590_047112 [Homalodisca vitripennis]